VLVSHAERNGSRMAGDFVLRAFAKEDPNRAFRLLNALMSWQDIEVNLASTCENNKSQKPFSHQQNTVLESI
jgi:hypothetical protein